MQNEKENPAEQECDTVLPLTRIDLLEKEFANEKIAEFVLKLYHTGQIQYNGLVLKNSARKEFKEFVDSNDCAKLFPNWNIGTLLRDNNFLFNTPRGSKEYCISKKRVFEFRNERLKQLDEKQLNPQKPSMNLNPSEICDKPLEASIEVSADAEQFPLVFQGGCKQQVISNFTLINLGCFICQQNFKTQSQLEDHISSHGFETDFEFLLTTDKELKKIFEINYRLCNKSHYFYFTMSTEKRDVIIEKIIIVQTRIMQFVKNDMVPYALASDGIDSFLVDSHLFTIGVEQPIVVIYSYKSDKATRFVEQHHFLRIEEFPQVYFPIRSCRLSDKMIMKTKIKLRDYQPDIEVKVLQQYNFSDDSLRNISEHFRTYLENGQKLDSLNVCNILKTVIQIEDIEAAKEYHHLRQKAAQIKRFGREYSVRLKNLPKHIFLENIVSVLDEVILVRCNTKIEPNNFNGKGRKKEPEKYFAIIEGVYNNQIFFKYDKSIINENHTYDISIRPSQLSLKYQLRALEMLTLDLTMKRYLFPVGNYFPKMLSSAQLDLFNSSIENNAEQLQAVRNIAVGPDVSVPYVIFGPPGTGKTSTIVETVLQLWKRRPDTRILISSGSNAACDEVAIRLCRVLTELQPEQPNILRIFAKSNEKRLDSIEDILIEASNFYSGHFYPAVESIREYRIIVCTLSVAGKLVSAAIGSTFFTHIFIDECAASTEPEVLVGWMGLSSSKTRLIVSGDHKQLGPILKSNRAGELGLKVSFMERLMNSECYAVDENGEYDRSVQTRLIRNYRSHPEIVALYNNLYYDNKLKALASKDDTMWALKWHMLPNQNHPIIFHSVYGSCRKSDHSVSLCNELEVSTVMDYVKDLMYFGIKGRKIEETDIGIISPYKKQYNRIQEELKRRQWDHIEVGAVETFQGKEKPIIIVSTVRSFTKTLGFLENPRRLNVMLSRAKTLLIMIGNPITLSQNEDFKFIIDECRRKGSTVGGFRGYIGEEPDIINSTSMTGSIENNLNFDGLSLNSKSAVRQTKTKKYNFKAKKSKAIKKIENETLSGKKSKESDFSTVHQLGSREPLFVPEVIVGTILGEFDPRKEANKNVLQKYEEQHKTKNVPALKGGNNNEATFSEFKKTAKEEPFSRHQNIDKDESSFLSKWPNKQIEQQEPRLNPIFKPLNNNEASFSEMRRTPMEGSILRHQNGISAPISKPHATVVPRRHGENECIALVKPALNSRNNPQIDRGFTQISPITMVKPDLNSRNNPQIERGFTQISPITMVKPALNSRNNPQIERGFTQISPITIRESQQTSSYRIQPQSFNTISVDQIKKEKSKGCVIA